MTTTVERSSVDVAREELERAEQSLALLLDSPNLGAKALREAEDEVAAARHRLAAAERRAAVLFAEGIASSLDMFARAAQTLKAEEKKVEAADARARAQLGEAYAAIAGINGQIHDLSARIQAAIEQGEAVGIDVRALAHERGIGPLEPGTLRLLGGLRIGQVELPKHHLPSMTGGVDRNWCRDHPAPPPPAPPAEMVCHVRNEVGNIERSYSRHIVSYVDRHPSRPDLVRVYYCERCRKSWPKAQYEAMTGIRHEENYKTEPV